MYEFDWNWHILCPYLVLLVPAQMGSHIQQKTFLFFYIVLLKFLSLRPLAKAFKYFQLYGNAYSLVNITMWCFLQLQMYSHSCLA